jgi:DNA repair protein RecN (Recombination protein N)
MVMLTHLVIKDFAVIEHVEIPFRDGFTVVTGQTGAGKSMLVNALNLVLGGRASTDVVRAGSDSAVVEAIFEPSDAAAATIGRLLDARGIDVGNQLIVRRIVARSGRNKVFINGCAASLTVLREVTRGLIDISGQHEHISLADSGRHIRLLDAFGSLEEERSRITEGVSQLRTLRTEAEQLRAGLRERLARIDVLPFQVDEIDEAQLEPGEDERLREESSRLAHVERLTEVARTAGDALYDGNHAVIDAVAHCILELESVVHLDPELDGPRQMLEEASIQLTEAAADLRAYGDGLDADPGRLAAIEDRLAVMRRLLRKHGSTVGEVLQRRDEMVAELAETQGAESRIEEAEAEAEELLKALLAQARTLSARRKKCAGRLETLVGEELGELGMGGTRFAVTITHALADGSTTDDASLVDGSALGPAGIDLVEFQLATSRAEPLRALGRIASGGELSRLMLAIKSVLLRSDDVDTYVFDEVDTGIGGAVAEVVGRKIKNVAPSRQVLCITHLPQIAACGDWHLLVEKRHADDVTVSNVRPLTRQERVEEVARMLGGVTVTPTTLAHAQEMMEKAG